MAGRPRGGSCSFSVDAGPDAAAWCLSWGRGRSCGSRGRGRAGWRRGLQGRGARGPRLAGTDTDQGTLRDEQERGPHPQSLDRAWLGHIDTGTGRHRGTETHGHTRTRTCRGTQRHRTDLERGARHTQRHSLAQIRSRLCWHSVPSAPQTGSS